MHTPIYNILPDAVENIRFPCWLWLPECSEWQWFSEPLKADAKYMSTVFSHWSPGGRPEAPTDSPQP